MGTLTIYTDASHDSKLKVAGYGYWVRDHVFRIQGSMGEKKVECSTHAEIRAIARIVLKIEQEMPELFEGKYYCVVVTDSLAAQDYYKGQTGKFDTAPLDYVLGVMEKYNLELRVNKVKAHNGTKDGARSRVNNICDQHAYAGLQKMRGKVRGS